MHTITLWHIHETTVSMKLQQCVLYSIVEVQNILYCLHFLSCHNRIIPFGWKILIIWRFYVTVNRIVEAYIALCAVWTESLYTGWAMSAVMSTQNVAIEKPQYYIFCIIAPCHCQQPFHDDFWSPATIIPT